MLYRVSQFFKAVRPQIRPEHYLWINDVLSDEESILFRKQPLADQRHALDVAVCIQSQKNELVSFHGRLIFEYLLKAALLHDCGKFLFPLRLWQRIFIVMATYIPEQLSRHMIKKSNILGKTMIIYKSHPAWGSRLAAKAGSNKEILILIQNHHNPENSVQSILFEADNRN